MPRPTTLLSLPAELHAAIALELAVLSPVGPPGLTSLLQSHSILNDALSFGTNPSLYSAILHRSWDTAAVQRRFGEDALASAPVAAHELKKRWKLMHRIRAVATRQTSLTVAGGRERAGRDMLAIWLLLTESDGRNLAQLLSWAYLPHYVLVYHQSVLLPAALEPNAFPAETLDNSLHVLLGTWLDELGHELRCAAIDANPASSDVPHEPVEQVDEKLFVLRPFALAPFKYNSTFAPWDFKTISPSSSKGKHAPSQAMIDSQPPETSLAIKRFGKDWMIRPPLMISSAVPGVLNQLDRTPNIITNPEDPPTASNSSTRSLVFLYTGFNEAEADSTPLYYDDDHGSVLRRSIPRIQLHSQYHDTDVRRSLLCSDASLEPRLGPFGGVRGKVEGVWHGSYSFYDFTSYRGLLAGEDQNMHEGGVGQQAQEIILSETVVRVPIHLLGGSGSALNAGYPEKDAPPDPHETLYSTEDEEADGPEGSGFAKELLIHGWGRSRWGECKYYGRVRAYDGLITLVKEYTVNALHKSKWFYRGYIHQDSRFVGVWRDTFSEIGTHGYESGFSHRKQFPEFLVPTERLPPRDAPSQRQISLVASTGSIKTGTGTRDLAVQEDKGDGKYGAHGERLSPPSVKTTGEEGPETSANHPATVVSSSKDRTDEHAATASATASSSTSGRPSDTPPASFSSDAASSTSAVPPLIKAVGPPSTQPEEKKPATRPLMGLEEQFFHGPEFEKGSAWVTMEKRWKWLETGKHWDPEQQRELEVERERNRTESGGGAEKVE